MHYMPPSTTQLSKFLSLLLRHKPETIGLVLDKEGWAAKEELIAKLHQHGHAVTVEQLIEVVTTNSKQRFAFNEDQTKIRASQGHSIEVVLNLPPALPPAILYHGTAEASVDSILINGLEKRSRQHVHLSADITTARTVGQRHGKPRIFLVDAAGMYRDGCIFYLSDNGVWLTDMVPVQYLTLADHTG
jgi:putative RNA 2'-phosphotransferase